MPVLLCKESETVFTGSPVYLGHKSCMFLRDATLFIINYHCSEESTEVQPFSSLNQRLTHHSALVATLLTALLSSSLAFLQCLDSKGLSMETPMLFF
ncbi:hypothetical protein RRG08_047065 [Elysia crispata]|uniref:Uncharacterized protein n=1 Tax=Elysia crispata TaxID=231223 RepID=A0AAE1AVG8_9GAST|nr:hypothetical protein RRG08_047065 [Elysia crispata]